MHARKGRSIMGGKFLVQAMRYSGRESFGSDKKNFKKYPSRPLLTSAHRQQGSDGDPECMFFTLNTYQATFISDIL